MRLLLIEINLQRYSAITRTSLKDAGRVHVDGIAQVDVTPITAQSMKSDAWHTVNQ